ncbi:hypothetical protein [Geodermatophilus marinus]|uniref:hypothetical protein n=1 Tax=Geodermatophilus sp. LHW52908 TaxID=2303986 RepID=UPI0011C0CF6A|nr:hypothetical protein [Geodermatophilus sp. LHW52908]
MWPKRAARTRPNAVETTAALVKLAEGMDTRQCLVGEAVVDARAAGVDPQDKSVAFRWEVGWLRKHPTAVHIRGERIPVTTPPQAIVAVLARAVTTIRYRMVA